MSEAKIKYVHVKGWDWPSHQGYHGCWFSFNDGPIVGYATASGVQSTPAHAGLSPKVQVPVTDAIQQKLLSLTRPGIVVIFDVPEGQSLTTYYNRNGFPPEHGPKQGAA